MILVECGLCHAEKPQEARGLCHRCYEMARDRKLLAAFSRSRRMATNRRKERTMKERRKGIQVSEHMIRLVWQVIIRNPGASYKEIMSIAGISSTSNVAYAVRALEQRGAIRRDGKRTSRTIVPCVATYNGTHYRAIWIDL